ncbi:hypothetical protein WJX84_003608 [Apatococcus fuscideae]
MVAKRRRQASPQLLLDGAPSEDESEDGEASSDDGSDRLAEVQVQAQTAKRKRPAKKHRTEDSQALEETTLAGILLKQKNASSAAARAWTDKFQISKPAAMAELLSMLIQACGVKNALSSEEIEEGDVDKLVRHLLETVAEEGHDNHFHVKGGKALRTQYLEFWDKLIRECNAAEILYDATLLETLSNLVIGLSCSVARNFRIVATLTASQLITSWTRILLMVSDTRETAQRQLSAEGKKKSNKAANERMNAFKHTVDKCHRQATELQDHISTLFQAVCAHRYRDVCEEVRATVVEGIGNWVDMMPAIFLQDSYLKYMAWALSDKDATVRMAAVKALLQLYSVEANLTQLHEITVRFKTRFTELPNDIDADVALKGIELLTTLVKIEELPRSQAHQVFKLLADDAPGIRHAAATLAAHMLEDEGQVFLGSKGGKKTPGGGKGRKRKADEETSKAQLQLAGVLQLMSQLEQDLPEDSQIQPSLTPAGLQSAKPLQSSLVKHIVDALFGRVEVLSNWRAMADAVTDDRGLGSKDATSAANIIQLMCACAWKATAADTAPAGNIARRKAQKAKSETNPHQQDLTVVFMDMLPMLLHKYQTSVPEAAALVAAVRLLKLDLYSLKQTEDRFEQLLQHVASILTKQVDPALVKECAQTLAHSIANSPASLQERARKVLSETVNTILSKTRESIAGAMGLTDQDLAEAAEGVTQRQDQDLYPCWAALMRLNQLQAQLPLHSAGVAEPLQSLVQDMSAERKYGKDVIQCTLECIFGGILWRLRDLEEAADPSEEHLAALQADAANFCQQLSRLYRVIPGPTSRNTLFAMLADLLLVFGEGKLQGSSLDGLALQPGRSLLQQFWSHCQAILEQQAEPGSDAEGDEDTPAEQQMMAEKTRVLAAAGRLVAFQALPLAEHNWLASQILSQLVGNDKSVEAVAKDVAGHLKKADASAMPQLYLGAMISAFTFMQDAGNDEEAAEAAEERWRQLCQRVVQVHTGFNASQVALTSICQEGLRWSLSPDTDSTEVQQDRLPFLSGLSIVAARLTAAVAAQVAALATSLADLLSPDEEASEWDPYFALLQTLSGQSKVKPTARSSLRKKQPGQKGRGQARVQTLDLQAAGSESEGAEDDAEEEDDQDAEAAADRDGAEPQHLQTAATAPSDSHHKAASDAQTTQVSDEAMQEGPEPEHFAHDAPSEQPVRARRQTLSSSEGPQGQDAGAGEAFHLISTSHSGRTERDSEGAQPANGTTTLDDITLPSPQLHGFAGMGSGLGLSEVNGSDENGVNEDLDTQQDLLMPKATR